MSDAPRSPQPLRPAAPSGAAGVPVESGVPVDSRHAHRAATEERVLGRHVGRSLFVAVPAMVTLWVGLVAVAISVSHTGYEAPLAMGAAVGVLAGLFWGTWLGVLLFSRRQQTRLEAARVTGRGPVAGEAAARGAPAEVARAPSPAGDAPARG